MMKTRSFGALYNDGYSFDPQSEDEERHFEDFGTLEEEEDSYSDPEIDLLVAEASSENLFEMMDI